MRGSRITGLVQSHFDLECVPFFSRLVGGLETLNAMERVEVDEKDRPKVRLGSGRRLVMHMCRTFSKFGLIWYQNRAG